ncbi:SAM-dependent methyltransferase [Persicimonas caeni]|uniref:SAM-dependent methyltransferase n=1 Tax=Persicimonas caeni TaxID=2292766 RepID=A0A4Y6PRH6_PERCE|nr:class I SAM-dependent methyltransferase [Persicimonas caeni]QDG50395.1 SAM-dependent methyltransferase [Persicimonas caeni]QED31616.1 SAM-dependent methyltransferase [Persicimonas caeni]
MSAKTLQLDDALHDYLLSVSVHESAPFRELREETAKMEYANMQTSPEQGQFMRLLAELVGAKRTIEVGTFTGYSAMCVASVLPDVGELVACDISEEWVDIGRKYWEQAGVADKIDVRIAPALETLDGLIEDGQGGSFDFAYIDADKENYIAYYERCLELVRVGGLIGVDNTLWGGSVIDASDQEESTVAIREFNAHVADDERVTVSLVPIGDGLTLARKR